MRGLAPFAAAGRSVAAAARRAPVELGIGLLVFGCCAFFFQGGGWNQNSHFATTVALVEHGSVILDDVRASTGDLARVDGHVVSNKAIGTSLIAVPAYLVAKTLTLGITNPGDATILCAYVTTILTSGLALALLAVVLYRLLRRRLPPTDACLLAVAAALATPLFPNSTMIASHPLVALAALSSFALLDQPRAREPDAAVRLFLAGVCAALPLTMEYLTAVIVVPLSVYGWWRARPHRRALWFGLGVGLVALVPLTHHTLVFGHPLSTGYASLVNPGFAAAQATGWHGFDGLSLWRLYHLTFGPTRGFFLLSPFLLAGVPGFVRLARQRGSRAYGLVAAAIAIGVLLAVASFVHWHSGSASGSRYALLFVTFSIVGVAAQMPRHRVWILLGMGLGLTFMVIGTAVTAIPPPPPEHGAMPSVLGWWWERFAAGNLASWQEAILVSEGGATGEPTLPFAFNLGQLMGLPGLWSLAPLVVFGAGMSAVLRGQLRRASGALPSRASPAPATAAGPGAETRGRG
ncbi:MAG: hypothetical protein HY903_24085 [Deltaproteobacteria bacterium]|nr:hypothetical protein [Deltaproteobacteria bacterium]